MTYTYLCGCIYYTHPQAKPIYLPRIGIKAHATILSSVSRTILTQTYTNPSKNILQEVSYTFPLYDGASVVRFKCQIGDRTLHSRVKPRKQAKAEYDNAVSKGESAALMFHSLSASDVFSIKLGNVRPGEKVVVELTLVGELKQDAQTDAVRYTLPNSIAPRYGSQAEDMVMPPEADVQGISITVDVQMESTAVIREIQSTSHSLSVALGRVSVSSASDKDFNPAQASASVNLKEDRTSLSRDFVLLVKADGLDTPRAMLETHSTIPSQRAIMTTLVPKFGLEPIKPEIIFVIDRSGSMMEKIDTLKSALRVFLKSLPVGVCFNICSFGSSYSFLWKQSLLYNAESLQEALSFVDGVRADMGGTEMQEAVEATVHSRMKDKVLEVLILTDGQIWNQEALFKFIRETAADNSARFFSLGIGDGASHSLVDGIARAGNGFSQLVVNYEELDRKVVRMLKGALTPHISDYKLEVEYDDGDEDFEVVLPERPKTMTVDDTEKEQQPISLFDADYKENEQKMDEEPLPVLTPPPTIQAPYKIPPLYPFIRTTAYILLGPATMHTPKALIFRATSNQGPLVLRIPIDDIGTGETIHQLAVRKAMVELEEGHGWLTAATSNGNPVNNLHPASKDRIIARECEKLGTQFQVTGKHCSFIALQKDSTSDQEKETDIANLPIPEAPQEENTVHAVFASAPGPVRARNRRLAPKAHRKIVPPPPPPPTRFSARLLARQTAGSPSSSYARFADSSSATGVPQSLFGAPAVARSPPPPPQAPGMGFGFDALMQPAVCPPGPVSGDDMMEMESADSAGSVGYTPASPTVPKETAGGTSTVHSIIALQSFEGYWTWSAELMEVLGLDERDIRARLMKLFQKDSRGSNLTVIATMLAMAYLSTKCADDRSVWELVYDKAEGWKSQTLVEMGETGDVLKAKENEIIALV
ncbi:von Willebrand factor A domain-containing protein 5A [Aspergillus udagawae]|uniref:von Willebrand factor A domain-containing protein 5A n=1 Tax=Aspergillus udagawae TaxID=91492 RepID=A0A8H3P8R6_9EURO|nr:von Willebrand factor A domain-containing protein 5A [Aspergillus udagawae]